MNLIKNIFHNSSSWVWICDTHHPRNLHSKRAKTEFFVLASQTHYGW